MTLSKIDPKQSWQMVLNQLQTEMSKASFDTWVRDTEFIAFENNILTVGTSNLYASEWLTNRLTNTVNYMLTGILNQPITAQFIVLEESPSDDGELEDDDSVQDKEPESDNPPKVLSLQAEYQSIYKESSPIPGRIRIVG